MISDAMVYTSLERRDIFREAVFLWITPLLTALSITDFAISSFLKAASLDFSPAAIRISLTTLFILVFEDLLRICLTTFCRARFNADL